MVCMLASCNKGAITPLQTCFQTRFYQVGPRYVLKNVKKKCHSQTHPGVKTINIRLINEKNTDVAQPIWS